MGNMVRFFCPKPRNGFQKLRKFTVFSRKDDVLSEEEEAERRQHYSLVDLSMSGLLYENCNVDSKKDAVLGRVLRHKTLRAGSLSDEHQVLIQLSWRCLTVVHPKILSPAAEIFKRVFECYPTLRPSIGASEDTSGSCSSFDSFEMSEIAIMKHVNNFNRILDEAVRNVLDLDAINPMLIMFGQDQLELEFHPEYIPYFANAILDFLNESVFRDDIAHDLLHGFLKVVDHLPTDSKFRHISLENRNNVNKKQSRGVPRSFSSGESFDFTPLIMSETLEGWRILVAHMVNQIIRGYQTPRFCKADGKELSSFSYSASNDFISVESGSVVSVESS